MVASFCNGSFPTIAGVGSNGAIIHYRATGATCQSLDRSKMLLLDSGAQYEDGTTDVTRTLHFGEPTEFQRECFTRVLQVSHGWWWCPPPILVLDLMVALAHYFTLLYYTL